MVQKTIKTIKQSKQSNVNIDYKDRAKISRSKMPIFPFRCLLYLLLLYQLFLAVELLAPYSICCNTKHVSRCR